MTHFLQSSAWQSFQQALGRETFTDSGDGWSYLAVLERGAGNTRLYTPYGPTVDSPAAFDAAIASLTSLARAHQATFLRVEPPSGISEAELRQRSFRPVSYQQLQPHATHVIDLTPPAEDILAAMSQNSRNITRNYHKKGITIEKSYDPADLSILTPLLAQVAKRNHITPHSNTYFQTQAETLFPSHAAALYIARVDTTPIAAALVYDSDTTRYYAHAAADDTYRKLPAGTALVGQMILDAKADGLSAFDFYGITLSSDPSHPWAGLTKFKRSFGGNAVEYTGAWDLPLRPIPYYFYRSYQTLRKRLR